MPMSYGTRRLNPWIHRILVVWVCICVAFAGILPRPQKAEAFAPLIALGAADILAVGTLAVAAGMTFPASQKVITAVAQDMWSRGGTLLQDAVHNATNTQIVVGTALWTWLKDYALNTAPLNIGSTMNIAQAPVIEGYTNVGNVDYTTMGTATKYIIPISAGTAIGTIHPTWAAQSQLWLSYTFTSTGSTIPLILQSRLYTKVEGSVMTDMVEIKIIDQGLSPSTVYTAERPFGNTYATGAFYPFQIDIDGTVGTVKITIDGSLVYNQDKSMTPTAGTKTGIKQYPNFDYISGWQSGSAAATGVVGFQYRAGAYIEQPMDTVIVGNGDLVLDPPYTRGIAETDTAIAFPVAKDTVTTVGTATQAITGVKTATLAQTDVATGTPKIPTTPPASPKIPWYAFFSYFLDMLRAMIEYALRLVSFLITLQSVAPLSMGEYDGIFQWFKGMTWGGIDLYSIVMSMFGLSLSLVIYRMVRKV